ncbi:LysM peptidoglycan-binding domain-containing protein [Paenibacillus humicola]|uniref:LysM peptidoglycan-binding domain-containing protein n=1 Tax=Paenibacillus humicola TaxID=3110540 RepID=UPI00237AAD6F|nr:LysM peptidoglycan-binding domain-containing protein [Paenibacillus humicola]
MMTTISTYSNTQGKRAAANGTREVQRRLDGAPKANVRSVERLMMKFAIAGLLVILLFSGLTLMRTDASGERPAAPTAQERVIVVGAGDTLWSIAGTLRHEGEDVRQIVYELKERNNLRSSVIRAGQTLIVPAD